MRTTKNRLKKAAPRSPRSIAAEKKMLKEAQQAKKNIMTYEKKKNPDDKDSYKPGELVMSPQAMLATPNQRGKATRNAITEIAKKLALMPKGAETYYIALEGGYHDTVAQGVINVFTQMGWKRVDVLHGMNTACMQITLSMVSITAKPRSLSAKEGWKTISTFNKKANAKGTQKNKKNR